MVYQERRRSYLHVDYYTTWNFVISAVAVIGGFGSLLLPNNSFRNVLLGVLVFSLASNLAVMGTSSLIDVETFSQKFVKIEEKYEDLESSDNLVSDEIINQAHKSVHLNFQMHVLPCLVVVAVFLMVSGAIQKPNQRQVFTTALVTSVVAFGAYGLVPATRTRFDDKSVETTHEQGFPKINMTYLGPSYKVYLMFGVLFVGLARQIV